GRVHVLDELDPRLLEVPVEVLDVGLVEIDLGNRRSDVTEGQHAELLTAVDQPFYLLKLLKLCYQHPVCARFSLLDGLVLLMKGRSQRKVSKKRTAIAVRAVCDSTLQRLHAGFYAHSNVCSYDRRFSF